MNSNWFSTKIAIKKPLKVVIPSSQVMNSNIRPNSMVGALFSYVVIPSSQVMNSNKFPD
ncbi:hypothetical protein [Flexistipes sinusarabici]|uniref:hypothetical protein n=1 Tax=Flexistipes sinusarabici TaxID=2352 RepID=UPI003D3195B1